MNQTRKGSSSIIVAIVVVVVVIVGFYLLGSRPRQQFAPSNQTAETTIQVQAIKSDSDLQSASQELDKSDVDGTIDTQLNMNSTDALTF